MELGEKDHAEDAQLTRTIAIYFQKEEKYYVAFDDYSYTEGNLLLERCEEMTALHQQKHFLFQRDESVQTVIDRAGRENRIIEAPHDHEEYHLEIAIGTTGGMYGNHPRTRALFGDQAKRYAGYCCQRNRLAGYVFLMGTETLHKAGVGEGNVDMRPVVLCGGNFMACVQANTGFDGCSAWARGVAYLR